LKFFQSVESKLQDIMLQNLMVQCKNLSYQSRCLHYKLNDWHIRHGARKKSRRMLSTFLSFFYFFFLHLSSFILIINWWFKIINSFSNISFQTAQVRPYCVTAVLRDVTLTQVNHLQLHSGKSFANSFTNIDYYRFNPSFFLTGKLQ
jgi:hypothetical protein